VTTKTIHIDSATAFETSRFFRDKLALKANRVGLEGWTLKDVTVNFVREEELWRISLHLENDEPDRIPLSCIFRKTQAKTYPLEQCEMVVVRGIPEDEDYEMLEGDLCEYIDSCEQVEGTGLVIWRGETWIEEHYRDFKGVFYGPHDEQPLKDEGWELP